MTGTLKNKPAACCCDPCDIDAFAGPVELTSAQQTIIRSARHRQSPYPFHLTVEIKADSSNAIPRLFVAWDESGSTGIYLDFHFDTPTGTSGTLKAYLKDGTQLDADEFFDGLVSNEWHTVVVCYDPDSQPNRLLVCIDPPNDDYYGTAYPNQCIAYLLADDFIPGRKAGYGTTDTHSGTASFRNYDLNRLWYCGDPPHTSDCHELCDDWDYYYSLPARTDCHKCEPCPTFGITAYEQIATSDTKRVVNGAANFIGHSGAVQLYPGDYAIFGWSDKIKRNQVYVEFTHNHTGVLQVGNGSFYDEENDLYYFWFIALGNVSITYYVKTVTNGGSPVTVSGPTTISPNLQYLTYWCWGDGSTTLNGQTRSLLYGTGTVSNPVGFGSTSRNCGCVFGGGEPQPARFSGTASGLTAKDKFRCRAGGTEFDFDVARLNYGGTLYNYKHLGPPSPFESEQGDCLFETWEYLYTGGGAYDGVKHIVFRVNYADNNCYTDFDAWVYAEFPASDGLYGCTARAQIHFFKRVNGYVDARSLSGEVIPFESAVYTKSTIIPGEPAYDWVDGSSAVFTVSAL